jgi:hypothetical protein
LREPLDDEDTYMKPARRFMAATALGLSLMATTAHADLTSAQVWDDWRAYLEGLGYDVQATQSSDGGTLALRDITLEMDGPRAMVLRIGALEFVENGDGSVDIVMPAQLPLTVDLAADDISPATQIALEYAQTGQKMIARGDPKAMTYDYAADTFALTLTSLLVDGAVMDADTARFGLTGNDIASQTSVLVGETRTYDQSIQTGNVTYDLMFSQPENVEALSVQSTLQAVTFAGTSSLPLGGVPQTQDMAPLLAAGFAVDGTFGTQGAETQVEITSIDGVSKIKTGSASSTVAVAMGPSGLRYGVDAQQVQIGAQLAGLPFPLFAEMEQSGFHLRTPVVKSDEPQDFNLAFNMTDFTMSDIIWAMFDPTGQLPRDPATVALDLSGKAKLLSDPLDTQSLQNSAAQGAYPAEVEALRIDRLTVDAVGAKLEAAGDVTLDNTDKVTLPGFPKPVGAITIDLAGANALLDKLVAMGLLPVEQVMGARMMMGVFAVPGDAPDTLKSRIEFTEAGGIFANGQRIK